MASSWGEAASKGLQTGFGMAMDWRRQQEAERSARAREEREQEELDERRKDRQLQRERDERQEKRLARQDERLSDEDALRAIDEEGKLLRGEMAGYYKRGQKDDAAEKTYRDRAGDISSRKLAILRKRYQPIIEQQQQAAADITSRIQTGQLDPLSLDNREFLAWIEASTKRDPREFLRGAPEGSGMQAPSRIGQAVRDTLTGLETNNHGMLIRGANVVLEPDLKIGVGGSARDGGEIVGKSLYSLIPSPTNPGLVMPVLKVDVQRADGARGGYLAPVTRGRTSRDDDEVHEGIDIRQAMDYMGALSTMEEILNSPAMRAKVEEALKERGDAPSDFLTAFYALGGRDEDLVAKRKTISRERMDLGGSVIEKEVDDTGKVLSEKEYQKTATPRMFNPNSGRGTGLRAAMDMIDEAEDAGEITPEQAREERAELRRNVIRGGGKGRGGGGPKAPSAAELKRIADEAERAEAGRLKLRRDGTKWVDARGRPISDEAATRLAAAREAAVRSADRGTSAALDSAKEAAAAPPPAAPAKTGGKDFSHLWSSKPGLPSDTQHQRSGYVK